MKERLNRAVLTEELFALTDDMLAAVILRQFLYWLPRRHDVDKYVKEEQKRGGAKEVELTGGWIYKSAKELKAEIMASQSEDTIRRRIDELVENGWLERRRNPKYGWDRTFQYRPDLRAIENDLNERGYTLATVMGEDFPLVEKAFSTIPHGAECIPHGAESKTQGAEALPEITSKTTTEKKTPRTGEPPSDSLKTGNIEGGQQNDTEQNGNALQEIAQAIADVCSVDLGMNAGQIFKEARLLLEGGATAAEIRKHFGPRGYWGRRDWRGKQGTPPTVAQIRKNWGKWTHDPDPDPRPRFKRPPRSRGSELSQYKPMTEEQREQARALAKRIRAERAKQPPPMTEEMRKKAREFMQQLRAERAKQNE
jgi:hypothetical protein